MIIGVPREIMKGELRVAATAETAGKLVQDGAVVLVESGAGTGSFIKDGQYIEQGARIINDPAELYEKADIILKVKEPQFHPVKNIHEVDMMHEGQYLISFIHPASPSNHEMVRNLAKKGVISLTLDGVPRISRAQNMDALTSMSTCGGYKGMLMGVGNLPKIIPQLFCAVGAIKPSNVLVVGAGVSGLQAIVTAKRMGAVVYAADIRPDAIEQAKSLGAKIVDMNIPTDVAVNAEGNAVSLSEKWLTAERAELAKIVPQMDVIFLGALVLGKQAPVLITEDMVKSMNPGSVIVDLSIDQGGNCAVTTPGVKDMKHGVIIEGIKNVPGMIPVTSTWMFANNVYNFVSYLLKDGKPVLDMNDEIISSTLTTYKGQVVHAGTREAMGL